MPLGSIFGPLFLLIYIDDLSDNLLSTVKLFTNDPSLFSVVNDSKISVNELNKWKMSFHPDLNKQAQEVVFSRKLTKSSHPKNVFNSTPVVYASWQKHLGMFLNESLNFSYHKEIMSRAMKGIGIIKKLFFKLGFTPCKAEQPLQGMELQEKETQKD